MVVFFGYLFVFFYEDLVLVCFFLMILEYMFGDVVV